MTAVLAGTALLCLLAVWVVVGFNRLRATDLGAQEALGGIDVQLTRRADLVPNLVEAVRGHAIHEEAVCEDVTRALAGVRAATAGDDVPAKAAADAALHRALVRIDAVVERHPDLRAGTTFHELHRQLAETENQIVFARQHYNDAVATLDQLTRTVPWRFLTGVAGVQRREPYEVPGGESSESS